MHLVASPLSECQAEVNQGGGGFRVRVRVRVRVGGGLPYVDYIGRCHCEGYGFQAVYSRIGFINQNVRV